MGTHVASLMRQQSPVLAPLTDHPAFMEGFSDGLDGESTLSDDERKALWEDLDAEMKAAMSARADYEMATRAIEQAAWLAEKRQLPEATTTPNGVIVRYLTQGVGEVPPEDATVRVHYHGTLSDGSVFDSSIDRGPPATLPMPDLIQGWREGMASVPVGSVVDLYIPPDLAYGSQTVTSIPPGSALAFRIHLLGIERDE